MNPIVGSIVALITPMHEDGSVDFDTLRKLIDWHAAEGTDCVSVVGTTGESPTVSVHEHCEIIRVAVDQARGRIPIMAGAGANSTAEAIELARFAKNAGAGANSTAEAIELARFAKNVGADCTLQVVPYYNKPTQEGIYSHFKQIAEAVDIPNVLYNVPSRTGADMLPETVLKLSAIPGIVGIKEATGNFDRFVGLVRHAPKGFSIYSGDDLTAVSTLLMGGHGTISVTANVAPRAMHELCMAAISGNVATAKALHMKFLQLHRQLLEESNPIPVKWALSRMKRCSPVLRSPLTQASESLQNSLEITLRELELI